MTKLASRFLALSAVRPGPLRAARGRRGEAIDIVSIHGAKGRDWPIVVIVNAANVPPPRDRIVHCGADDTLHWTVGGVASHALETALASEADDLARERARLPYVGGTRARAMLAVPDVPGARPSAYSPAVDLSFDRLPGAESGRRRRRPAPTGSGTTQRAG